MTTAPGSPDRSSFVSALFDFDFRTFVGLRLIKVVYLVGTVLLGLTAVVAFFTWTSRGAVGFLVGLFVLAVLFVYLLVFRVYLEVTSLLYRISENVALLAAGVQPAAPIVAEALIPAEAAPAGVTAQSSPQPSSQPPSSQPSSQSSSQPAPAAATTTVLAPAAAAPAPRRQGPALIPASAFTQDRGQRDEYATLQEEYAAQQAHYAQAQYAQAQYDQAQYAQQGQYDQQAQYAQAQYDQAQYDQAQYAQQGQYDQYGQYVQQAPYPAQAGYPAQADYAQAAYAQPEYAQPEYAQPGYQRADYAPYPAQGEHPSAEYARTSDEDGDQQQGQGHGSHGY